MQSPHTETPPNSNHGLDCVACFAVALWDTLGDSGDTRRLSPPALDEVTLRWSTQC